MRLAYLVQCHKNPGQINRMIRALSSSDPDFATDFYVYVDKKSDMDSEIMCAGHVFLIEESKRIDVCWGQISQIDAVLTLFREALASGRQYDYFWLISGQDYPIKSNAEIFSFFQKNQGKIFMQGWGPEKLYYRKFLKRNKVWYPPWLAHSHYGIRILLRLYILLTGGWNRTFACFERKQTCSDFVFPTGEEAYYFGSAWFTITRPCVEYILDYVNKHKEYYAFFKNALVPDECFFLTILFNSPFKKNILDCLCYVDWSAGRRSPKVLAIEDYDKLAASAYLIARKFDEAIDAQVLDRLDQKNEGRGDDIFSFDVSLREG